MLSASPYAVRPSRRAELVLRLRRDAGRRDAARRRGRAHDDVAVAAVRGPGRDRRPRPDVRHRPVEAVASERREPATVTFPLLPLEPSAKPSSCGVALAITSRWSDVIVDVLRERPSSPRRSRCARTSRRGRCLRRRRGRPDVAVTSGASCARTRMLGASSSAMSRTNASTVCSIELSATSAERPKPNSAPFGAALAAAGGARRARVRAGDRERPHLDGRVGVDPDAERRRESCRRPRRSRRARAAASRRRRSRACRCRRSPRRRRGRRSARRRTPSTCSMNSSNERGNGSAAPASGLSNSGAKSCRVRGCASSVSAAAIPTAVPVPLPERAGRVDDDGLVLGEQVDVPAGVDGRPVLDRRDRLVAEHDDAEGAVDRDASRVAAGVRRRAAPRCGRATSSVDVPRRGDERAVVDVRAAVVVDERRVEVAARANLAGRGRGCPARAPTRGRRGS